MKKRKRKSSQPIKTQDGQTHMMMRKASSKEWNDALNKVIQASEAATIASLSLDSALACFRMVDEMLGGRIEDMP